MIVDLELVYYSADDIRPSTVCCCLLCCFIGVIIVMRNPDFKRKSCANSLHQEWTGTDETKKAKHFSIGKDYGIAYGYWHRL